MQTTRYSTTSFYSKIGIERNITERKHFSVSFPFVLGYREQKENIYNEIEEIYTYRNPRKYAITALSSKTLPELHGSC